ATSRCRRGASETLRAAEAAILPDLPLPPVWPDLSRIDRLPSWLLRRLGWRFRRRHPGRTPATPPMRLTRGLLEGAGNTAIDFFSGRGSSTGGASRVLGRHADTV